MRYRLSQGSHQAALGSSVCGFVGLAICQSLQVRVGRTAYIGRSGVIGF